MKKIFLTVFMTLFFFFGNISLSSAQPCYAYDTIPYAPDSLTTPQLTNITLDDQYSTVFPIGFSFCFYGNNYTQCVIGSNGILSFNVSNANGFCPWSIATPSPSVPLNSVLFPWEDLYPPSGGAIRYQMMGTPPYRKFVVNFANVPFRTPGLCPGIFFTGQAILFETMNSIEIHITNNPVCSAWNSGRAIIGIKNSTGTDTTTIYPSTAYPWTQTFANQAFRFYPVCSCPYSVEELDGTEFNVHVFPNPSENNFNVRYELKQALEVTAGVYNTLGELIISLTNEEKQPSGSHKYNFTLSNSGIYFLKLRIGNKTVSRKFVVTK